MKMIPKDKVKKYQFWGFILALIVIKNIMILSGWIDEIERLQNKSDVHYGRYVVIDHRLYDSYTCLEIEPYIFSTIDKDNKVYIYGLSGYTIIEKDKTFTKAKKITMFSDKEFPSYVKAMYYRKPILIEKLLSVAYIDNRNDLNEAVKNQLEIEGALNKQIFTEKVSNWDTKVKGELMMERIMPIEEERKRDS